MKRNNETKCDKEARCVICPYRYCIDEEEMYQRLVKETMHQVGWGLHWIHIWFEKDDEIAQRAFVKYRKWLREHGFEGNEPSYKTWIEYTEDTHEPVRDCGGHDGTFYFHEIKE